MENTKPLITVIIPTYRRPHLLKRAIRSVLNQTFSDFQVCVYDNASSDETRSVVEEILKEDRRVKYFCHLENIGAIENFNYGLKNVDTQFFSFLSDDDVVLPNFLKITLEGFEKYPDAMFSAGSTIYLYEEKISGVPLLAWSHEGYYPHGDALFEMAGGIHPAWTGILFRREVISTIGLLSRDVGAPVDLDFELRIAARCPIVISKKPCAIFVIHPSSKTGSPNIDYYDSWPRLVNNIIEDEKISSVTRDYVKAGLKKLFKHKVFNVAVISIIDKNYDDALKSAVMLNEQFGLNIHSKIIVLTVEICKYIDITICYKSIIAINKIFHKIKNRKIQGEYGEYVRSMLTYNETGHLRSDTQRM